MDERFRLRFLGKEMDHISRMAALSGELRREMNGDVVASMRFRGEPYGWNYGVSLPTIRTIARREAARVSNVAENHAFALCIYRQKFRELRLAAFHFADPQRVSGELDVWAAGLINTEAAAEAALLLFSRMPDLDLLLVRWLPSDDEFVVYAALLAAARTGQPDPAWIVPAMDAVKRHAASRPVAEGAVALLAALAAVPEYRPQVCHALDTLSEEHPQTSYIREEMAWRLAV